MDKKKRPEQQKGGGEWINCNTAHLLCIHCYAVSSWLTLSSAGSHFSTLISLLQFCTAGPPCYTPPPFSPVLCLCNCSRAFYQCLLQTAALPQHTREKPSVKSSVPVLADNVECRGMQSMRYHTVLKDQLHSFKPVKSNH